MAEGERGMWLQVLLTGLDDAPRAALEALMNLDEFRAETPFYQEGLSAGLAQGLEAGLAKGEARSISLVLGSRARCGRDSGWGVRHVAQPSAR